jgi:tetratricopeptide (TPR) repeat protein
MKKIAAFLICLALLGCGQARSGRWARAQQLELQGQHRRAIGLAKKALDTSLSKLDGARKSNLTTARFGFDASWLAEDVLKITKALADHERAELYAWRGFLHSSIGEYDMAVGDYDKALELDKDTRVLGLEFPARNSVLYLKALALWQGGRLREAVAGLDKVISTNPEFQGAYYYRGVIKSKMGDPSGSTRDLKKAVEVGGRLPAQEMLDQTAGKSETREPLAGTFLISFFANQPPLSRPYGYIWMVEQ